jgi:D-arginine dehydrogenase
MKSEYDVVVVGAGIAGASVAAELQRSRNVLLLEMESQPGYHSTGRSAAVFAEGYGPPSIRALTRASASFFNAPPDGFVESRLLAKRGGLFVAGENQLGQLDEMFAELSREQPELRRLDRRETCAALPLLRKGYVAGAMFDPRVSDIDVHALHQGYLRLFRALGGDLRTKTEVADLQRTGGRWRVQAGKSIFFAPVVVNAAGAWAETTGKMAGAVETGLVPKRRTALTVEAPREGNPEAWPLCLDCEEHFYLKPDAGRLLISPANEDPEMPCDVQPDELDIAICIDRIQTAFAIEIRRIENRWAGLRSFVADRAPVCGYDPQCAGFFWLAGQGGYGIQSAPALSRTAAALVVGDAIPDDILAQGLQQDAISPARLGVRRTN